MQEKKVEVNVQSNGQMLDPYEIYKKHIRDGVFDQKHDSVLEEWWKISKLPSQRSISMA